MIVMPSEIIERCKSDLRERGIENPSLLISEMKRALADSDGKDDLSNEEYTAFLCLKSAAALQGYSDSEFNTWIYQIIDAEKAKAKERQPAYQPDIFMRDLRKINSAKPHKALFRLNKKLFMPKGEVCVLASEGGIGKSLLALHLGISLVMADRKYPGDQTSEYLHLRDENGEPLVACQSTNPKVVLLFAEESENTISYRLKTLLAESPDKDVDPQLLDELSDKLIPAPLRAHDVNRESDLSISGSSRFGESDQAEDRFQELYAALKSLGSIDLIVIDPLAQFGGGDFEKDNGEASRLMRQFQRLTGLKGNPAVLLIHHSPKTKSSNLTHTIRGASALRANSRWAGLLRRVREDEDGIGSLKDEDGCTVLELVVTKSNYGPSGLRARYLVDDCNIKPIAKDAYHLLRDPARDDESSSAPRNPPQSSRAQSPRSFGRSK